MSEQFVPHLMVPRCLVCVMLSMCFRVDSCNPSWVCVAPSCLIFHTLCLLEKMVCTVLLYLAKAKYNKTVQRVPYSLVLCRLMLELLGENVCNLNALRF